ELQRLSRDRETLLHRRVIFGQIAHHATILQRQAVGIFKVDRPSPTVIDDIGDLDAFGAQLVAFLGQSRRRTGLESKMIEAGGYAEPAICSWVVLCRDIRNSVRFDKGDQLITPDIKKDVPKISALHDLYRVGDDWFEAENALVKLAGL